MISPEYDIQQLIDNGISKKDIINYWQHFFEILENLESNILVEDLAEKFDATKATVTKKLKEYLRYYPDHIPKVIGFYPSYEAIIDLAEKRIGALNKTNIFEINMACKSIVDSITWPKHEHFIKSSLQELNALTDNTVTIDFNELAQFMYDDYSDFLVGSGNGLVSIAGRMNEEILLRALETVGLVRDKDFKRTGTNSVADIQFYGAKHITLYCEVKSYKARERFLRGLRDIPYADKIGVGFFLDPKEFNPTRTKTLLAAQPKAIYLPDETYNLLPAASKESKTVEQHYLYRQLSRFVDDMAYFVKTGTLPSNT